MQELLFQTTSFLFYFSLVLNSFSWIALWEEKEHDPKRVFIHLKETSQGRNIIFGFLSNLKWLAILSYSLTILVSNIDFYFHLLVFLIYILITVNLLRKAYLRELIIPKFYIHTFFVLISSLTVITTLFFFPPLDRFLWIILLDRMLPILIALFLLIASISFDFKSDIVINKAVEKIRKRNDLLTIAIIGSYAKGTTHEFISEILKVKFNILKSRASFNSVFGVAESIVKNLTSKKQIFIVEMEDYKFGSIGEMCAIINPKIVIVTGINEKNIAMLGTMENIILSKFQGVEELAADGIALFNGDDSNSLSLYEQTKQKRFLYSVKNKKTDILITNLLAKKFTTSIRIRAFGKSYKISNIKLIGTQNIQSLLPGIFVALYLGVDFHLIREAVSNIRPLTSAMNPKITESKTVLVDDTYNVNYNSVIQVLNYIKIYKGKRIMVMEPLVEFGKNSKPLHAKIGNLIGKRCTHLFLTNHNYEKEIAEGVKKSRGKCKIIVSSPSKIAEFVEARCGRHDVVVFEGREAKKALSLISYESIY